MTQLERIAAMEQAMRRVQKAVDALCDAPDLTGLPDAVEADIAALEAYYAGADWKRDFADDEAGLLPRDLPRGVLSEDGLYHLFETIDELRARLRSQTQEDQGMNEVIQSLKTRRSIRKFKPDLPPKADIAQIVDAGLYAANGRGKQAVITIAVTDKALRDKISADNCRIGGWPADFDPFYGAPVILIVLADKSCPTGVYDGALVMGNLMQAAHALGLGSIWIHRAKEEFETDEYKKLLRELGVEGEWEGIGHCAVGYADCDAPAAAPRKDGRVFWVE